MEKGHTVGDFLGAVGDIVRYDHLGESKLLLHFADQIVDRLRHQRIDHGRGFVVKNGLRFDSNSTGDRDSAFHSRTELRRH